MRLHPDRQRLDSPKHQPGIEWRENRAGRVLDKLEALGIVFALQNGDAADAVAVAIEVLRGRMNNNIGAKLDRPLEVRRHERIVDSKPAVGTVMRDFRERTNVRDRHDRVCGCLDKNHTRVGADGSFDIARIRCVDVRELDAVMTHDFVEEPECSAINVVGADGMIALFQQQLCERGCRRHPRRECISRNPAFKNCHVLFKSHTRRVLRARVFKALVLAQAFLDVG